jgi:hypothetical protein
MPSAPTAYELNNKLIGHMSISVSSLYSVASHLALRAKVQHAFEVRVAADHRLYGDMAAALHSDPLFFSNHRLIDLQRYCNSTAKLVLDGFDAARTTEQQTSLIMGRPLTNTEIEDIVHKAVTVKYGSRFVLVAGDDPNWAAKDKWPYIRYVKHCDGDDFNRMARVRKQLGNENYDAQDKAKLFALYGQRVNAAGYNHGHTLQQLF